MSYWMFTCLSQHLVYMRCSLKVCLIALIILCELHCIALHLIVLDYIELNLEWVWLTWIAGNWVKLIWVVFRWIEWNWLVWEWQYLFHMLKALYTFVSSLYPQKLVHFSVQSTYLVKFSIIIKRKDRLYSNSTYTFNNIFNHTTL